MRFRTSDLRCSKLWRWGSIPVDREYWIRASELAKIGGLLRWRGNRESREICPELTQLLELPRPHQDKVLRLADGEDPFCCFPLVNHSREKRGVS